MDEIAELPKGRCVTEQERISLLRRAVFAFSTTMASFGLVVAVLWLHPEGSLGEKIVSAVMSYAELMAMLYLGASVIDRTKLVDRVAGYWDRPGDTTSRVKDDEDMR